MRHGNYISIHVFYGDQGAINGANTLDRQLREEWRFSPTHVSQTATCSTPLRKDTMLLPVWHLPWPCVRIWLICFVRGVEWWVTGWVMLKTVRLLQGHHSQLTKSIKPLWVKYSLLIKIQRMTIFLIHWHLVICLVWLSQSNFSYYKYMHWRVPFL